MELLYIVRVIHGNDKHGSKSIDRNSFQFNALMVSWLLLP